MTHKNKVLLAIGLFSTNLFVFNSSALANTQNSNIDNQPPENSIDVSTYEVLDQENQRLQQQLEQLKEKLARQGELLKRLSNRTVQLHEELVTQTQIQQQLIQDLGSVASEMQEVELSQEVSQSIESEIDGQKSTDIVGDESIENTSQTRAFKTQSAPITSADEIASSYQENSSISIATEGSTTQTGETDVSQEEVVAAQANQNSSFESSANNVEGTEKSLIKTIGTKAIDTESIGVENSELTEEEDPFSPKEEFKAATFKLLENVTLVDDKAQPKVRWKKGTSFTSRAQYGEFYKVSGYFVKGSWTPTKETWLIPIEMTFKR